MMDHRKCTKEMGGEVSRIIDFLNGKPFKCDCGNIIKVDDVVSGYPHDDGYEDKDGKKWWLYLTCHHKNYHYDWALWKIVHRVRDYREKLGKRKITSST